MTKNLEQFRLSLDSQQRLVLHRAGEDDVVDVRPRRSFPWSDRERYISLRSSDGKELILIESLDDVPRDAAKLINGWLDEHNFIPKITRVHEVDVRFGFQLWKVETDRGPAEFRVQEREDIRFLHDGRFSLKDADGNVYELTRLDKLDPVSRAAVESLL